MAAASAEPAQSHPVGNASTPGLGASLVITRLAGDGDVASRHDLATSDERRHLVQRGGTLTTRVKIR